MLLGAVLVDDVVDAPGSHLEVLGPHGRVRRAVGSAEVRSGVAGVALQGLLAEDVLAARDPGSQLGDLELIGADLLPEGGGVQVGLFIGKGQLVDLVRAAFDLSFNRPDLALGGPDRVGAGGGDPTHRARAE